MAEHMSIHAAIKILMSFDLVILLLGTCPEEIFFQREKALCGKIFIASYPSKGKGDGLERAMVLESGVWGLMAWFGDLPFHVYVVLDKWLDLPESSSAGRKEGNQVGRVVWNQSMEDLDCKATVSRLCELGERVIAGIWWELYIRKISLAVAYNMNKTGKKVEVGRPLEGFCRSVYERQWLIKWNSLNCVSTLWVMSHYHKSPASP